MTSEALRVNRPQNLDRIEVAAESGVVPLSGFPCEVSGGFGALGTERCFYDLRPLAIRRERGFRFGFCPVAALMVSEMTARCWRLIAAVAALVHAPAARFAMLRKRLRGDPFMSSPPVSRQRRPR